MELTMAYVLSQIFIIINYIFLVVTYQLKNRKSILIFNFAAIIVTGLSYVFLSAWSGLAMVGVAIIRNIIFIVDEKKNGKSEKITKKDIVILIVLYMISIISAIFTYEGFLSLMSVFATMLYTFSIWQKKTGVYKVLGIPVSIIWIIYNIYIASIFGIILEIALLTSAIIGFVREYRNKTTNDELIYKKVEEKDKNQLLALIKTVLEGLEDQSYFIPYEDWEYDSMFDEKSYAPLYGAYDGEKLVGMAQLYVSQEMLAEFKREFELTEYTVCELGGNLILPEYRGRGITTKLQTIELELAKELGFDYIISMAHPDNVGSLKTLEKVGLEFIRTTTLSNGFLRSLYMKKLK